MKIEELIAFLDVGEYGTELLDYGWGPTDVDDAITEIADGHVSIFKYDALRFLSAHPELVDDAIREYGWEACGGTLMGASNMGPALSSSGIAWAWRPSLMNSRP